MEMRGEGKKKSKEIEMLGGRLLLLLPEDIIVFKILVRLPVVDVIRCTCVCKQWCSLIKTPQFISTHLSLSSSSSSSRSQPSVFIHRYSFTRRRHVLSSHFDPQYFSDCRTIQFPFPVPKFSKILGPINGLFCLCNTGTSGRRSQELYCLWNPSVRRYIRLPSSPTSSLDVSRAAHGFGFDDKTNDYKVVVFPYLRAKIGCSDAPNCHLFSLKQGSWRTLVAPEEGNFCVACADGCFLNGALHWVADKGRFVKFVLAFDIALETFRNIELPEVVRRSSSLRILETKGSLACVDYYPPDIVLEAGPGDINCYSIWVMKEYGVANSWVKMWTFDLMGSMLSKVYGFWGSGDEILMGKEDDIAPRFAGYHFLYDTKTQRTRAFAGDTRQCIHRICTYTGSLILLDRESGAVCDDESNPHLPNLVRASSRLSNNIFDSRFTDFSSFLYFMKEKLEGNAGR